MSARLEDKLTLATEEGTKLTSGVYSSWRSTKKSINIIARQKEKAISPES